MFKVGDSVICIDNANTELTKYEKYIIFAIHSSDIHSTDITYHTYLSISNECYYHSNRFVSLRKYRKLKLNKICLSQETA